MHLKLKILLILFFPLMSLKAFAQMADVISHYPTSAYVINRLLPFTVASSGEVEIKTVTLLQGDGDCITFVDIFYPHIFHFHCSNPTTVQAQLIYEVNNQRIVSETPSFTIFRENSPSNQPTPGTPSGSLFNKGGS